MAHVIVVGNEKGGAGKSTLSMNLATALARMTLRVGLVDLDLRQRSLSRYMENRQRFMQQERLTLPTPVLAAVLMQPVPKGHDVGAKPNNAEQGLSAAIEKLKGNCDFIVIDCPGAHTHVSELAHALSDTLITPLNDSFVDFDLLAQIETDAKTIIRPSVYAEMVWSARQTRAKAGLNPIDWVVVRNRLGMQNMINKQKMAAALAQLSRRIGFRIAPGFGERVIFRELFPRGLTLLDLRDVGVMHLNMSNLAARQELRDLVKALRLPGVAVRF